jgi:thiamine-monophosphate kinase
MKLSEIGEDRLVAELARGFALDENVRVGVGDDCAVIGRASDKKWQLLKTDCIVESVHFERGADPKKIGWKAMARPLSDIAAMGGLPRYALVTLGVSPDAELARVKSIYAGIRKAEQRFDFRVVGGETSRSPGAMFLSVAIVGEVEKNRCVTRAGGRAGDLLYVTGRLGGSIRGRHLDFIPRIDEARWLTEHFSIRAMMDLSDGLGADLPRLARASGTGFEIFEDKIPRTKGCSAQNAISDGEDYELLFAVAPRDAARLDRGWRKRFPKLPLTRIGKLATDKLQPSTLNPQPSTLLRGFDHFARR